MDFETIISKLNEIDKKYQDSNSSSELALKSLGDEQHKLAQELAKLSAECIEMQKRQENYPAANSAVSSIGEKFVKSNSFKSFSEKTSNHVREAFDTKAAVVSTTTTGITDNFLGGVQAMPGIIGLPNRKLVIESLIPHIPTTAGSMSMVKETAFSNYAAVVAEGGSKPESYSTFEKYNVDIETVAHWTKISEQLAADAPAVQAFINTRMAYGLQDKIDSQLISGTGTSGQLSGLLNTGNYHDYGASVTPGANDTLIDFAARVIAELEDAKYVPEYIMLNPKDWTDLTLLKDTQKRYILGGPGSASEKSLWGVPVITSSSITQGKYLIPNLSLGAAILDRQELVIDMERTQDDFIKNLLTIRVERRLGLAILDANAIAGGNWALPSSGTT